MEGKTEKFPFKFMFKIQTLSFVNPLRKVRAMQIDITNLSCLCMVISLLGLFPLCDTSGFLVWLLSFRLNVQTIYPAFSLWSRNYLF